MAVVSVIARGPRERTSTNGAGTLNWQLGTDRVWIRVIVSGAMAAWVWTADENWKRTT